ncbi:MAG: hypothetical protein F6J93_35025 [Oscillatoria sp. SIO1A7]|nr:hypothetical protein [Oscillatoria sp. SIO1A7]
MKCSQGDRSSMSRYKTEMGGRSQPCLVSGAITVIVVCIVEPIFGAKKQARHGKQSS